MGVVRNLVAISIRGGTMCFKSVSIRPLLVTFPAMAGSHRYAHSQQITNNIRYISNYNDKLKADSNTMMLNKRIQNPLCVIMNWMMARPKHVEKYAKLYLEHGFDVVSVTCTPWQLLWPSKGSQMVGSELLKFLEANDHKPIVVHGFSVGAYVWAELLVRTTTDKERYQPVLDRIVSQVWDSAADIHEIPVGFPSAVLPRNKFLQETFRSYIKSHMKIFHKVATKHYMRATQVYHATPCRAPGLFLVSRSDPVGAARRSRHVHDCWQSMGIKCNYKCWDKSPHVSHYIHHPQEYKEILYSHLEECGAISQQKREDKDKIRAKL